MENGATSIKITVDAHIHLDSDIRAFYAISDRDGFEPIFTPFPGYDNLEDTDGDGFGDRVLNAANNSGRPDAKVEPNVDGEFSEYQFSAENLEPFTGFKIKIVMSGTNEAYAPRFKDFRAIALA